MGEWSIKKYGAQSMPFNGFLFTSRVMVVEEAHMSLLVKDLIVTVAGVDNTAWEGTYTYGISQHIDIKYS